MQCGGNCSFPLIKMEIRASGFILSVSNSMEPDYPEELLVHYLGSLLESGSLDVLEEFRMESAF